MFHEYKHEKHIKLLHSMRLEISTSLIYHRRIVTFLCSRWNSFNAKDYSILQVQLVNGKQKHAVNSAIRSSEAQVCLATNYYITNILLNCRLPEVYFHQANQETPILMQCIDLQIHHLVCTPLVSVTKFSCETLLIRITNFHIHFKKEKQKNKKHAGIDLKSTRLTLKRFKVILSTQQVWSELK